MINFLRKNLIELIVIIFSLLFSFWLMFSTFSYNDGSLLIATKAWSDFASHIPLIRSFSFGNNFPPEYPLFSGEPMRYHFLLYTLVGFLEKIGIRIDYALNIPSVLSFVTLILMIYFFAKTLFKSRAVGVLSVIFFLFNGSFSFLEFFKIHSLSLNIINDILTNTAFPSFGPYDGKIVSAFWNLNIYTNQRHLALPLAFLFLLVFLIIKAEEKKKGLPLFVTIILGLLIGFLPFSHSSIFIMVFAILGVFFFLLPKQRKSIFLMLFVGVLVSLPRVIFLKETATYNPHIQIGYLIANEFTLLNFIRYWSMNLGLAFILMPLGVLIAPTLPRKIFLAFLSLFLIGNFIQFSPEMASNHKFFNTFLVIGNMLAAFLLVNLWQLNIFAKIIVPLLIFLLIFSGIIDFFPIKNDSLMTLVDYPKNPDVEWIMKNTPKNATFLNSTYLYNPASLAGRKIFLGWPYFPWSLGYNTVKREELLKKLYNPPTLIWECQTLKENKISYISFDKNPDPAIFVNEAFLVETFDKLYQNPVTGFTILNPHKKCELDSL